MSHLGFMEEGVLFVFICTIHNTWAKRFDILSSFFILNKKKKKKLFNTAITPQLCYGLFTTLWHYINAVIHTKGAPYKVIFVVIVIVSSMCCVPSRHSSTVPNGFQLGFLGPRLTYQELAARNKCCINKMHIKSAHTPNIIFSWELPPAFISSRQQ